MVILLSVDTMSWLTNRRGAWTKMAITKGVGCASTANTTLLVSTVSDASQATTGPQGYNQLQGMPARVRKTSPIAAEVL